MRIHQSVCCRLFSNSVGENLHVRNIFVMMQGVKPNSFEKVESEDVKEIIDVCIRLKKEER